MFGRATISLGIGPHSSLVTKTTTRSSMIAFRSVKQKRNVELKLYKTTKALEVD